MKRILPVLLLALVACAQKPPVLAFHGASREPASGYRMMLMEHTGDTLYVEPEPFFTGADVDTAFIDMRDNGPVVSVLTTGPGREKLSEATRKNMNLPVAIVVEGRLVAAPIVRAPIITGRAIIDGGFSDDEALALVANLNRKEPS